MPFWLLDMMPTEIGLLEIHGELIGEKKDLLRLKLVTLVVFSITLLLLIDDQLLTTIKHQFK